MAGLHALWVKVVISSRAKLAHAFFRLHEDRVRTDASNAGRLELILEDLSENLPASNTHLQSPDTSIDIGPCSTSPA